MAKYKLRERCYRGHLDWSDDNRGQRYCRTCCKIRRKVSREKAADKRKLAKIPPTTWTMSDRQGDRDGAPEITFSRSEIMLARGYIV